MGMMVGTGFGKGPRSALASSLKGVPGRVPALLLGAAVERVGCGPTWVVLTLGCWADGGWDEGFVPGGEEQRPWDRDRDRDRDRDTELKKNVPRVSTTNEVKAAQKSLVLAERVGAKASNRETSSWLNSNRSSSAEDSVEAWSKPAASGWRTSESAAAAGKTCTRCFPARAVLASQGAEDCV